jgi:hypothetical protein
MTQDAAANRHGYLWLALPMLAAWLATQCYSGLWHDSVLYSFQAQAHLHPDLLGNDLFLRYGSQDRYSLFPPIYAALIQWLGLENAAEVLTLLMQALLLYAIWHFASRQLGRQLAILGLAAAITMPCNYGATDVFRYIETFVTPRMAAEALALLSVTAWLDGGRVRALLLLAGSCLLHPLMGVAAAAMVAWHVLLTGRRKAALVLVPVALAALVLASRHAAWRIDDYWLATIRAGLRYLMLTDWNWVALRTALLPLLLLACAVRTFRGAPLGVTAAAALATGMSGLALSYLGGDLLHLTLIIQSQPWRWMWLSALVAAVLLPPLVLRLWNLNSMGRSALFLLAAVYLLGAQRPLLILTPLVLAAAWCATSESAMRRMAPNHLKLCERGAQALTAIALIWNLSSKLLVTHSLHVPGYVPDYYSKVYLLTSDGALPTLALAVAIASWYLAQRLRATVWWYGVWSLALVTAVWLSGANYLERTFPAPVKARFTMWQTLIPPRTEVFMPDDALAGWTMLLRPSYYSLEQSAGEVFSRTAAMELRERARAATTYVSRHGGQIWPELVVVTDREPELGQLCASTGVSFVVTRSDLQAAPLDVMPDNMGPRFGGLKLYACPGDRHG